ncbi:ArsR/SmtB family transcription factor [Saccharicrinis aurantiacus]|uniref:ArsR/SmtB family transcription factor n=1 Tax=Saccharicrinis aurantiacus TaxID=1849719 RepID=UPI00248FB308|nr:metalloregulator ArsR/SmtB family transcription factor [Saccharicrinis aurantiacus]
MKPSIESSITIFKALSEITRLKIIWLLINIDSKICVSEIIEVLKVPQYNVSRHLGLLKKAGILEESKEGKWVYYCIKNTEDEFMHFLQKAISTISKEEMASEIKRCKQRLLSREA